MSSSGNDKKPGKNDSGPGSEEKGSLAPPSQADPGDEAEEPATTVFTLPRHEAAALMPETPGKLLAALRSQIGQLTIERAGSGIRHEDGRYVVLPKTLRSAWMARVNHPVLGEFKFLIGQTRSTWVLLYDQPHEKVYEDPRFLGVELKRTDATRTPKGKQMFVSRIGKADLVTINAIAAQDAGLRARPDTLAPTEGAFSQEDTLARMQRCTLGDSTDADFDLDAFIAGIRFITPTQGSSGNYYYIEAGGRDKPKTSELHVGTDPHLPEETYGHKATLAYKNEPVFLYIDTQ